VIEYNYRFKVAKLFIKRRDFMNLEKLFHLEENHTDVRTEVMAGITTFMTMAYILAVNPSILSASGMDSGAVFTATALASAIATLLMAALSNYPFVLAAWD
jgi:AGZA family xanthine/uracil permease-like MFS transporter